MLRGFLHAFDPVGAARRYPSEHMSAKIYHPLMSTPTERTRRKRRKSRRRRIRRRRSSGTRRRRKRGKRKRRWRAVLQTMRLETAA